ncbi:hypothetical protein JOM56_014538 [Amanita muscaria]
MSKNAVLYTFSHHQACTRLVPGLYRESTQSLHLNFTRTRTLPGFYQDSCARHGCYAPNALVNLFRGEQQKNVDFAFLQALKTIGVAPQQGVMLIYDIACQYFVHFRDRIGQYLPTGLAVDRAIGLFHVHAHKDECFFRFASSFIPGVGIVAGEILESLWSNLNAISPTVRTVTLAHRAEMLDDHATDSNHRKLVGMALYLCSRHAEAVETAGYTTQYYADLSGTIPPLSLQAWETEILAAEEMRAHDPSSMDIYATRMSESYPSAPAPAPASLWDHISSIEDWIELMILVEEKQIELQDKVRHLGQDAWDVDRQSIERKREMLTHLLLKLKQSDHLPMRPSHSPSQPIYENEAEYDNANVNDESAPAPAFQPFPLRSSEDCPLPPEWEQIHFPLENINLEFQTLEISLRKQQANRQLH